MPLENPIIFLLPDTNPILGEGGSTTGLRLAAKMPRRQDISPALSARRDAACIHQWQLVNGTLSHLIRQVLHSQPYKSQRNPPVKHPSIHSEG